MSYEPAEFVILSGASAPISLSSRWSTPDNARNYTLTRTKRTRLQSMDIHVNRKNGTTQNKLQRTRKGRVCRLNHKSEQSTFELLLATAEELKGLPARILHRPDFWFEVELNLDHAALTAGRS